MEATLYQNWQAENPKATTLPLSGGVATGNTIRAKSSDDSAHQVASSGHSGSGDDNGRDSDELLKIGSGDKTVDKTTSKLTTANSKNRAAQRRYRERQKGKMETYKTQVEELSQRLMQLQTENESLENRNRLLEKVVQMKDERQTAAEPSPATDLPEPGPYNMYMSINTFKAVADYMNAIRKNREPLVTPQDAAKVSPDDLKDVKAEYVRELASLLLMHAANQKSEGFKELEEYVLGHRLAAMRLLGSMSVKSFAQIMALKMRQAVPPLNLNIKRVMDVVQLTPDQKRAFLNARKGLLERTQQIKEKRREIVKNLELAVPNLAPLMCGQQTAMLQACEASDAFKASLEEEHHSTVKFHMECSQVFSPLQEANSLLESHPANPDPWLVSGYLEAEEAGSLDAWLQSQGAVGPHTFGPPSIASVSSAQSYSDGDRGLLYGNGRSTGLPSSQQLNLEPLQVQPLTQLNSTQPQTSGMLDPLIPFGQGLDTFGEDDMWLDLFPGLGSVKPA